MANNECCSECPWVKTNPHSLKWREYAKTMSERGLTKDMTHACHKKSRDVWGIKEKITEVTLCQGVRTFHRSHHPLHP